MYVGGRGKATIRREDEPGLTTGLAGSREEFEDPSPTGPFCYNFSPFLSITLAVSSLILKKGKRKMVIDIERTIEAVLCTGYILLALGYTAKLVEWITTK